MQKPITFLFICLLLISFQSGCEKLSNTTDAPTKTEIQNGLELDLPTYIEMDNFQIITSNSIDTSENKLIKGKYKATAKLNEALYISYFDILTKSVLEEVVPEGKTLSMTGFYTAEKFTDTWTINFGSPEYSPAINGKPLSSWKIGEFVYANSDEEKALITEKNQILLAEKKAKEEKISQQNEIKKLAVEKEKQRLAGIELSKQNAIAAKKAKIEKFKSLVVGTWTTTTPMLDRTGAIYTQDRKPRCTDGAVGFKLTIPNADTKTVAGSIRIYSIESPHMYIDEKTRYVIDIEKETMNFSIRSSADLYCSDDPKPFKPVLYSSIGSAWRGKITSDSVTFKGGRSRTITLQKVSN